MYVCSVQDKGCLTYLLTYLYWYPLHISTLCLCAWAHYLQGCHPDVPCSDRRRTTVSAAIRPCCWRAFSPQTPVLYFWRPNRPGCSTDLRRLSRFSCSRSPHLEHATTARHLCLVVNCI